LRLIKDIFREVDASHYMCEAFIKITRLFEDNIREMEAVIRKLRLFQRLRGILEIFSGFFKVI
jgi:hypothetical protein